MTSHYFIGIPLSNELKLKMEEWQAALNKHMDYKVWTHPEDFHITLKFLGACSLEEVEEWVKQLDAENWPSAFRVRIGPAGCFGDKKKPRVFFAEVSLNNPLMKMKEKVEQIASLVGSPPDKRKYAPHVTLAKKHTAGVSPIFNKENIMIDSYVMTINKFYMYKIHPQREAKYECISEIRLRGGMEDGSAH
ncbi:RNA 2',3'-cyclic phosphodiesterase [Halobacillus campisalis]|uniref:RNA 2',3'-cyclic phosphodiesterase n=1 Tax=Halobacillus campisalis TaxID=435909 RepID=A0ABW2K0W1_9BACI|nr:RNA 2',3'-cyclic phosphodiesterase [Halobacillus campisalis]